MPYPTLDSLPDGVKVLPKPAQEIWRNAFNSAYDKYHDDTRAAKIAWGAVENAGWTKDKEGNWKQSDILYQFKPPDAGDAPEAVKSILSEAYNSCRTSWVKEHPDDKENQANKESCAKIAWAAVKKAGWAQDSDEKWKKDHAQTFDFDAEIFSAGTWNGDDYTIKDLDSMVENFDILKEKVKPPVKLGHSEKGKRPKWEDGQPALGWVKGLRRVGKKLIASLTRVPEIVHKAIKAGLYERVSAEIFWNYKSEGQTFNRVLAGVALLGTDIPAVENLDDLDRFLSKHTGSFDARKVYSFPVIDGEIQTKEGPDMGEEEIKKEYEAKLKKAEKRADDAESKNKEYEKEKEERDKKEEADLKKSHQDKWKAFCEDQVKKGLMTPADRDLLVDFEKLNYTKEAGYTIPTEILTKVSYGKVLDKKERGRTGDEDEKGDDIQEKVHQEAMEYAKKYDVSYRDAVTAVLRGDTELAREYVSDIDVMVDDIK